MRFPKKRYTTARTVPTNAPSPVAESTEAQSPYTARKDSERVPAQKPRPIEETNAPFADTISSTTSPAQTASPDAETPPSADLPDELIAARAYEIWQRRGCPMGQDSDQDWHTARAELEAERRGWTEPQPGDRNRI